MSNFVCEQCGAEILDTPTGYTTGCPHYPLETLNAEFAYLPKLLEELEMPFLLDELTEFTQPTKKRKKEGN